MSAQAAPARPPRAIAGVHAPRPLLPADVERALSERQREILDALEALAMQDGFAALTMAQLAARVNCSLRTLYALAPRKDALLLMVIDRRLHRIGRAAMAAIEPDMDALTALRAYLEAATIAVAPTTEAFARQLATVPGAEQITNAHANYVTAVTERLLERAVAERQIGPVDTGALALVLGGLGLFFSRPRVIARLRASPKATTDAIVAIVMRGLSTDPPS
ncbi:MAG TPA: TetR/AcrR family transcriptional regulator [Myxococcota bacterium]|nr:TetR/AcrR family transcriptional regulator [Myxococcota bacterium]